MKRFFVKHNFCETSFCETRHPRIDIPSLTLHRNVEFKSNFITLKPIESVDFLKNKKCFTFFDETQISFSKNRVNLVKIEIKVEFPIPWFPYDSKIGISIAVHSPNVLPSRDRFYQLNQGTIYNIFYSKIEVIRLHKYDNCIDRGDIKNYNDTRNYCLDKCFINLIQSSKCYEEILLKRPHSLRRNQLPNQWILDDCQNPRTFEENTRLCNQVCNEDCYQAHYFVNIEQYFIWSGSFIHTSNQFIHFEMKANSIPNIIFEHFVEVTLISFICNFGGLIGMYLGISLESIFCDLWQMTKKTFIKINNLNIQSYLSNCK